MARSVASLAVSIVARTDKFRKGMRRATRILKKFGASVRSMALKVAKFGSVLAGVAVGGLALFIKQSFAGLDVLAKTSDKLGIQIDQLRGLERAMELTGGSAEQFRKSIIAMSKNINEAAQGTGEAIQAFEDLGLKAEDLVGLSPDKALVKILKKLDLIPGSIRRIGIAADIFGARSGTALLNLAALGPKLKLTIAGASRLFGKFTRVQLNAVERANDAIGDMFRSLRGIADRLAVEIAPVVEQIAFALTDAFVEFRKNLTSTILPAVKKFFVQGANFADLFFATLKVDIADLKIATLTTIAEVLAALRRDTTPILKIRERVKFRALRGRDRLDMLASGRLPLLGDRLAKRLGVFIDKAAAKFQEGQADREKRREAFMDKLRVRTPSAALAGAGGIANRVGQFQSIDLSRQSLRNFPGQKREQIVKDPEGNRRLDMILTTLRNQDRTAIFGR